MKSLLQGLVLSNVKVNLDPFILFLNGLKFCAVTGWGVTYECCYVLVSNIFGDVDGKPILSILILFMTADVFTGYFPHSILHMFKSSISGKLGDIFWPWLAFLPVEESPIPCLWPSKADMVSPQSFLLCRTLLPNIAYRVSMQSSSNQGFDF